MKLPSWVKDTLERGWWTFLAAFLAASGYQTGVTFESINLVASVEIAAVATVLSMVKSAVIAHTGLGDPGTASAVKLDPPYGRHARRDDESE